MEPVSCEVKEIKFTLPVKYFVSLNPYIRWHWSKRARLQKELDDLVYLEIRSKFKTPVPMFPMASLKVIAPARYYQDTDNVYGGCHKMLADAIKKTGLIQDDSPKFLKHEEPEFLVGKTEPEIIVRITLGGYGEN